MTKVRKKSSTTITGKILTGKRWRRITSLLSSSASSASLNSQHSSKRRGLADNGSGAFAVNLADSAFAATMTVSLDSTTALSADMSSGKRSQTTAAVDTSTKLNGKRFD